MARHKSPFRCPVCKTEMTARVSIVPTRTLQENIRGVNDRLSPEQKSEAGRKAAGVRWNAQQG